MAQDPETTGGGDGQPAVVMEQRGDLFDVDASCALAHCVSADAAMGAGIALGFRMRWPQVPGVVRAAAPAVGSAMLVEVPDRLIVNLVTKPRFYDKPTYETLRASLEDAVRQLSARGVRRLAMPRIGSGLDRLAWSQVRQIIDEVFAGSGIEVVIRSL